MDPFTRFLNSWNLFDQYDMDKQILRCLSAKQDNTTLTFIPGTNLQLRFASNLETGDQLSELEGAIRKYVNDPRVHMIGGTTYCGSQFGLLIVTDKDIKFPHQKNNEPFYTRKEWLYKVPRE